MKKILVIGLGASLMFSSLVHANPLNDIHDRLDETWDKVSNVQDESRDMNSATNDRVTSVQNTLYEEGLLRADGDRIVASNAQKKLDAATSAQQKINQSYNAAFANIDSRIGHVNNRIDKLEDKMRGAMANAMAAASLVAPTGAGNNSLAVGLGGYDGANSMALGYTRNINDTVSVKTVVAYGSESEFSYGASMGFNF